MVNASTTLSRKASGTTVSRDMDTADVKGIGAVNKNIDTTAAKGIGAVNKNIDTAAAKGIGAVNKNICTAAAKSPGAEFQCAKSIGAQSRFSENADAPNRLSSAKAGDLKWCVIPLSEVVARGQRLEAGVFDVEARQARETIRNCKYPTTALIGENSPIRRAYYGGRSKRNYVPKEYPNAIGFIGSSEMLDIYPHAVKYMVDADNVQEMHVSENTVLLSRSGTIGNVSFVNKTLSKFLVSEHAMRLECEDNAGYIYAFLKTETGKKLVRSNNYGAVIQQIEPEHLAQVPIPDAPAPLKAAIHERIHRSYELRDESNALIDDATKLLTDELRLPPLHELEKAQYGSAAPWRCSSAVPWRCMGVPKIHADDVKNLHDMQMTRGGTQLRAFQVKLSGLDGRADASYHLPVVGAIVEHLHKHAGEVTTIGDIRISSDVILPGRFKRVYVEEGHGRVFIGGKQLGELNPSNKKYLSPIHHGDRIKSQLELHENMTLITCSGTIGKVALVGKHWENWTANQHIIRVIPSSDDIAGYLYIFLSSGYGHRLITKFTYGSVVDEIDDKHVRQIPVPLLKSCDVQKEINHLALQANEKRYEAFRLEQEAIEIMNEQVIFAK